MAIRPIYVFREQKGGFVYILLCDRGPVDNGDPWDTPFRLGWDADCYITLYRMDEKDFPQFEKAAQEYTAELPYGIEWVSFEETMPKCLGKYDPHTSMHEICLKAGVSVPIIDIVEKSVWD